MATKIVRWGNSLGIRIPKQMAKQAQLREGDEMELSTDGNQLILTPQKKKYTLEELLDGMTIEHLHSEVDWGETAGKEQW